MGNFFFLQCVNLLSVVFQRVSQLLAPESLELVPLCSIQKVNKEYGVGIKNITKDCL